MLKTIGSTRSAKNSEKTKGKASGNNVAGGGEVTNQISLIKRKNQAKITKFKILVKSKNRDFLLDSKNIKTGSGFLTFKARLAFTQLRQACVEALILYYLNLKCYIQIETKVSRYAIDRILNQLILENLG